MKKDEVLELKAKLEADFQKKSEAIDIVLAMLQEKEAVKDPSYTPIQQQPATTPTDEPKKTRTRGLQKATRRVLPKLPADFTKFDVIDLLKQDYPVLAEKMKPESLRGTLATLVDDGVLVVKRQAAGSRPAVYSVAPPKQSQIVMQSEQVAA